MDFLNKAFGQIGDLLGSMTNGARITAALLLTVVIVSLAWLVNHQVTRGDDFLLDGHRFSSDEMAAAEGAFGSANLNGHEIEGGRIRVPRAQRARYMAALVDAGAMPAHFGSHLLEAISKPGPFTSARQAEAMAKVALQRELAAVIGSMAGIERATVMYHAEKKSGFRREGVTTASVSVKPMGNKSLTPMQVTSIRDLVAGPIGMPASDVVVVDTGPNGRSYRGDDPGGMTTVMDDPYLSRKKEYQKEFENTVAAALSFVDGATVTASVELDREMQHTEERTKVDPKPVAIEVNELTTTETVDSSGPAGRPGLESQQRANQPAQLASSSKSARTEKESSSREEQNVVSHEHVSTQLAGLTPKQVMIAVAIPATYYEKVWREQNPTPAGQAPAVPDKKALEQIETSEKAKIQNLVAALMPQSDLTQDNRPTVTVSTFQPLSVPEVPEPALSETALHWLSMHYGTLGMGLLGLVSLVMLRSMVRSGPPPVSAPAAMLPLPMEPMDEPAVESRPQQKAKPRFKRRLGTGPSMRDELVDMVREDPDAAASILRGWIGNAG